MSDLLKQAIADAKAVRATALANAKAALEEAFTPKLQSMLGEKLRQEVAAAEDTEEETGSVPPVAPEATDEVPPPAEEVPVATETAPEMDDVSVEEPVESPETSEPAAVEDVPPPVEEVPAEDEELPVDEVLGQGHPDSVEQTELFTEEKDGEYKKKTKGHKTEDPQGASNEFTKGPGKADKNATTGNLASKAGSAKASTDYKKTTSGHKTPDPQGPSKEVNCGPGKGDTNSTGKTLEENVDEIPENSLEEILKELEQEVAMENCGAETVGSDEPMGEVPQDVALDDEEINLDELLSEEKEECEEEDEDEEEEKENKKPEWLNEIASLKNENQEYRKTINYLRDRLNEINLLNAKLLYTNKLFKQANMTNEQKLKVIESFDLTKSVREAKLVYATLAESINIGAKKVETPVKKSTIVKAITEGLASKAVASTKPTKAPAVLTEGAEMANRFKKLAGIRS